MAHHQGEIGHNGMKLPKDRVSDMGTWILVSAVAALALIIGLGLLSGLMDDSSVPGVSVPDATTTAPPAPAAD